MQEVTIGKGEMNLYVGNLPFSTNSGDLEQMFAEHGSVTSAQVIMDRETGRSRGFGFVEMGSDDEGRAAIQALDGNEVGGRNLKVNEAKPRN
jgi:RNA recognition motif-containing protein